MSILGVLRKRSQRRPGTPTHAGKEYKEKTPLASIEQPRHVARCSCGPMLPDRGLPPLQKRALKVIHSFRVLHTEVQIVDFLGLSRLESRGSLWVWLICIQRLMFVAL